MDTAIDGKKMVRTKDGSFLTIADGTEANVSYRGMLTFWEKLWAETKARRPDYSVVEDYLIDKRLEVERENQELDV